jgi:hypothetical protein
MGAIMGAIVGTPGFLSPNIHDLSDFIYAPHPTDHYTMLYDGAHEDMKSMPFERPRPSEKFVTIHVKEGYACHVSPVDDHVALAH